MALETASGSQAAGSPRSGADRCPTTTELHRSDDGQIARVRLPGGRISPEAARVVAAVAAPGDSIEITSRGNLQLRALSDADAERASAAFATAGLVPSAEHDRARTILASPLLGRLDGSGVIAEAGELPRAAIDDVFVSHLDEAIRSRIETTAVSGRVLTVVSDGTAHAWAADADLLIAWDAAAGAVALTVGGVPAATVPLDGAAEAAATLLGRLAEAAVMHGVWRARELPAPALSKLAAGSKTTSDAAPAADATETANASAPATAHGSEASPASAVPPLPIGVIAQRDGGVAVRAVLTLGRLDAAALVALADLAEQHATDLRIDHERGITLVDLPAGVGSAVIESIKPLGLIASTDDPALGLSACAGLDCPRTEVDVRAAAQLRIAARRAGDPREHLVGCGRRCGAPRAGTTVVAEPGDTPQQLAARAAEALAP